jgi:predicted nucleic acid-binding protein
VRQITIVDTGILVAYLNRREKYHEWTKDQLSNIFPPLITCEAVIAESCFLLKNIPHGNERLFELLESEFIFTSFQLEREIKSIKQLMIQYSSVPMSLADACLVRMSELYSNSTILTLDSDFNIYRKHKRFAIDVILPGF